MEATAGQLGRALKHARLTSHHPAQVYTAAAPFACRGDWGLKKRLGAGLAEGAQEPNAAALGKMRYVEVQSVESSQGQMQWKENERDPLFLQRWSEKNARVTGLTESEASRQGSSYGSIFLQRPRGALGPQIRTVFDPSTYRPLPTDGADPASPSQPQAASRSFGAAASNYTTQLDMFPNYNSMSPKQFASFLKSVRRLRPRLSKQFQGRADSRLRNAYVAVATEAREKALRVAKSAATRGATIPSVPDPPTAEQVNQLSAQTDLWDEARTADVSETIRFIRRDHLQQTLKPENRALPQQDTAATPLHFTGGLQYSQPDEIFTQQLSEPLPGRIIMQGVPDMSRTQLRPTNARRNMDLGVASGGHVEQLPSAARENLVAYDPSRPSNARAEGRFRVISASMDRQMWAGNLPAESLQQSDLGYVRAKVRPATQGRLTRPGSTAFVAGGLGGTPGSAPSLRNPFAAAVEGRQEQRTRSSAQRTSFASERESTLRMLQRVNQHVTRRDP